MFAACIITVLAISKNSRLWLASEAEQPGLSLIWSETPKTGFLVTRLVWDHPCTGSYKAMVQEERWATTCQNLQNGCAPSEDSDQPGIQNQNQNQNCYWWHVQMTIIHQDLWWGKLVPSPYKRSELSNRVFCSFSSRKESICKWIPISNSLGKEAALVNVSISKGGLKYQRVVISDMLNWGDKVIRRYTGCTLQTFVKHYDSTISPPFFRDSHFSCSRIPVMLPVS